MRRRGGGDVLRRVRRPRGPAALRLRPFLADALAELLSIEWSLVRTLRALLLRPGSPTVARLDEDLSAELGARAATDQGVALRAFRSDLGGERVGHPVDLRHRVVDVGAEADTGEVSAAGGSRDTPRFVQPPVDRALILDG